MSKEELAALLNGRQYGTAIPHATFEILEDDEKYCKGIVFNLTDLPLTDTAIWK